VVTETIMLRAGLIAAVVAIVWLLVERHRRK
jgi:hypothetical protein